MATTLIDEKGRIQIPERIRKELRLKSGEEFEVKTEGKKITLLPLISPEEFIGRMEGKLKSGNKTISPEEIKSIWKM
ncbi:MAG: AbrB/MazE/SpoVT family DNA-binding domain-containing protein [Candidatus Syntrophoarchaeum sp.]|nr:AbrB/MazE/SpoVT family DNA-binding domain-containing protein [Methanomicrobia archaeon]MBL7117424.1 AbrB/MazE/SpoVT family DNA-binding domain-containing protein [Candidatus Syntrophoarchaeum sp.]